MHIYLDAIHKRASTGARTSAPTARELEGTGCWIPRAPFR